MSVLTSLSDLFGLYGRVALITGGSRGIGLMIAKAFARHGARVYISSRKADACHQAARDITEEGGVCHALPQDVSSVEGSRALAQAFLEREEKLDILVNNAGAAWGASLDSFPEEGWDKVLNLNLRSPFFLTQALLTPLRAAADERPAKVINIASIDGLRVSVNDTYSYQASKAALIHLTRKMGSRLIAENICVNAIAPGAFASEMNRAARDDVEAVLPMIPARRIGSDEDIQAAALYLAARSGDYLVGSTLVVDGGVTTAAS
ncbi:SDR family oxidoreductase [Sphingobium chlorophenolicum]|uniref:Short-chain dehydrogenase/reductase SDR n=1 Tax=Sphingobium chlorophenolicum TaxID=46429 RepID=A0A081RFC2_SPHCR|nr:SDR family oxidoreductase [Sphingobium chlorophenolicum]KEQ53895.1 Short-chain dehydrogenase/reductase SDR [Sphingobium chlorophenolicum]